MDTTIAAVAKAKSLAAASSPEIINIPEFPNSFEDRSALENKSNLQSQRYQDFIHTLYRYDKDNLKRVDNLFVKVGDSRSSSSGVNGGRDIGGGGGIDGVSEDELHQPSYADYIKSQSNSNFIGIMNTPQLTSTKRFKRSAQGAIFRPLFVYRIFQERVREREEKRLLQQQRRVQLQKKQAQEYEQQQQHQHEQEQYEQQLHQLHQQQQQRKHSLTDRRHASPYLYNDFEY